MTEELELKQQNGRVHLRVRVSPGARTARFLGVHGGALKLSVCEPPERGKANDGVIRLLSNLLGVTTGQIELVSGHTSQDKRVAIAGLDEATLHERLASQA